MEIIKKNQDLWDPFEFLSDLQTDVNRAFDRNLFKRNSLARSFSPEIEVSEEAEHFTVRADMPGLQKEDFNISVEGNVLTLQGERKEEKENKKKGYHYTERFFGSFSRSMQLPTDIKAEAVKATYKNGVLEITLPKSETAKPKNIQVEVK